MSSTFWDQRYASDDLAYGEAPNDFLVQMADRLPASGKAMDIGAGGGRNALFLASRAACCAVVRVRSVITCVLKANACATVSPIAAALVLKTAT